MSRFTTHPRLDGTVPDRVRDRAPLYVYGFGALGVTVAFARGDEYITEQVIPAANVRDDVHEVIEFLPGERASKNPQPLARVKTRVVDVYFPELDTNMIKVEIEPRAFDPVEAAAHTEALRRHGLL